MSIVLGPSSTNVAKLAQLEAEATRVILLGIAPSTCANEIATHGIHSDVVVFCMMLRMLIVYAKDNHGDDDTYGENNDNDNVAPWCPCCYVTFEMPPIQKSRVLWALRTETSNMNAKLKQRTQRYARYLRRFQKPR